MAWRMGTGEDKKKRKREEGEEKEDSKMSSSEMARRGVGQSCGLKMSLCRMGIGGADKVSMLRPRFNCVQRAGAALRRFCNIMQGERQPT